MIGKSRLLIELQEKIKDTKCIAISFGNGATINDYELKKFVLTVRFLYMKNQMFGKYEHIIILNEVLNIICSKISQYNIIIAIDEFQNLITNRSKFSKNAFNKIRRLCVCFSAQYNNTKL